MKSTRGVEERGEFLLMLLVAIAVVGVLAGVIAPVLANKLDEAQIRTEAESLRTMRKDFEATYDSIDYNNLNEAAVPASGLPDGTTLTTFDQANSPGVRIYSPAIVVDAAGWVTKLAQKRGVTSYVVGASYTALTQNQYCTLAFNAYRVQRCLLIGPSGESGQQRYLLLSLMVPPNRVLAFPSGNASQIFNSIWDQNWESTQAQAPPLWSSLLSPSDFSLWNTASANNRTNASRVIVERIVQPKYSITLANNSPTDMAWVDIGPALNAIVSPPNSGTVLSSGLPGFNTGILAGRQIVVRRGPSTSSAYEVQRFFLYSDVNLTVQ